MKRRQLVASSNLNVREGNRQRKISRNATFRNKPVTVIYRTAAKYQYVSLFTSKMPMVLLIKVSDMQMMWFITCLSPYVHEPFTSAPLSPLHGNFSANMQDIDTPVEAPSPI
jgi:hypothetical protein